LESTAEKTGLKKIQAFPLGQQTVLRLFRMVGTLQRY